MKNKISIAVLGATGYVGLELIYILSNHPNTNILFLGSNSNTGKDIKNFDNRITNINLPKISSVEELNLSNIDLVFLALPHKISQEYVKKFIDKVKIIDLSADFRIKDPIIYNQTYNSEHTCPKYLKKFVYGLPEINFKKIKNASNISIPGCYPTSVLIPLIPLIRDNLIKKNNIIIDSKSGFSGAGKKFDRTNIFGKENQNFYNYNTNEHRHMCEIRQELFEHTNSNIEFSFNPHILPIFRGMMTTIYCDLESNVSKDNVLNFFNSFFKNYRFVETLLDSERLDFFKIQNTNYLYIKLFKHYNSSKIIIVSAIDNLVKGASGQAIQCMNIMFGLNENLGFDRLEK